MDTPSPEQPLSINHHWQFENQIQDSARQIQFQKSQDSPFQSNLSPENSGSTIPRPPEDLSKTRKHSSNRKNLHTWSKDTCYLTDDGFQWRKYGQKVIQNEKYPRNYFRCTHKDDQGCLATKQVQRIQEQPPVYRTTYHGHHTCKTHHSFEEIITKTSANSSGCFSLVIPSSEKESQRVNSKICGSNSATSFNLLNSNSNLRFRKQEEESKGGKDLKLLQSSEPLNLTLSLSLSL